MRHTKFLRTKHKCSHGYFTSVMFLKILHILYKMIFIRSVKYFNLQLCWQNFFSITSSFICFHVFLPISSFLTSTHLIHSFPPYYLSPVPSCYSLPSFHSFSIICCSISPFLLFQPFFFNLSFHAVKLMFVFWIPHLYFLVPHQSKLINTAVMQLYTKLPQNSSSNN